MAKIYGTPIGGGGTGTNTTLPPLLDSFKAKAKGNISKKGHGESVNIIDSIESELNGLKLYGKSTQDGTPTPENPIPIVSAGDGGTITVTVSDGADQSQTLPVSTPNGLPGVPVDSGGNYTDADGQQWVCDEIDFARGKYVQRFKMLEFDGTENWEQRPTNMSGFVRFRLRDQGAKSTDIAVVANILCNYFNSVPSNSNGTYGRHQGISVDNNGDIFVYYNEINDNVKNWKSYLAAQKAAGTPVKVVYELETPVETNIPEETIEAYKSLTTYAPVTNIMTDSTPAAGIEIEYASTTMNVELSADKMATSRANELAGAVWVYGDHEPTSVNDGTKIQLAREEVVTSDGGEAQTVTKTVEWNNEADFFARQFTYNSKKQYQTMLEGALASVIVEGAPAQVTDLVVSGSGGTATLTWVNPVDDPVYVETVVVQKVGSAPSDITDGTEIYRGTDQTCTATGLEQGTDYYFAVYTVSGLGVYGQPVVSDVYRYDFPEEPTDYLECAEISETTEFIIPENGYFRIDAIAAGGTGGNAPKTGSGYGAAIASCGGGGRGGNARSEVALQKGTKILVTISRGSVTVKSNGDMEILATPGGRGGNPSSPTNAGAAGTAGGSSGGNIFNESGISGNPGNSVRTSTSSTIVSGGAGATAKVVQINQTRSFNMFGGKGRGVENFYGNAYNPIMETSGNEARVFISRGNTNIPSPSAASTLSLTPRNASIEASWTNSGDPESVGTILVSSSDHVPVHPTDGTSVDVAGATTYTISDLPNDTPTYVSLFAYNADKTKYSAARSDVEIPREVTWYDVQKDLKEDVAEAQEEADSLTKENLTMASAGISEVKAYCEATSNPPMADVGVFASGVEEWKPNTEYKLNDLFTYQGNMGYVKQPTLTSLGVYPPFSVGTEALYGARSKPDADGVYPYVYNMGIYEGMLVRDDDGFVYRSITGTQEKPTELLYHPKDVPALMEKVEEEVPEEPENPNPDEPQPSEEYPEWVQPTGAHDAYAQGAKVSHNGKKWTSDIAANVWEPGVYGWTEVIE